VVEGGLVASEDEIPALEFALLQVLKDLEEGRSEDALVGLAHAVWVARTRRDSTSEVRLRQLVNRVMSAAGEL